MIFRMGRKDADHPVEESITNRLPDPHEGSPKVY
jgi:hypothetical protein